MFNAACEVVAKVASGEEMTKLCDFMLTKQDEQIKLRHRFNSMSSKDQYATVDRLFAKPTAFFNIPRRPVKIEKFATLPEVQQMLAA